MSDGVDDYAEETGRGSPLLLPKGKSSEIRSGMGPAPSKSQGETDPNHVLLSLATTLEKITKQQQVNAQSNNDILTSVIAKAMGLPQKPRLADIYIAPFDPDGEVPVRDWCEHVDRAKEHWKLTDYEVCSKIAGLLKGRAKTLGDLWLVKSPVWKDMREALIQTFEPEARYSNDVVKLRNFKFDISNPAESVTKAWNIWKRIIDGDKDRDAVEAVIGCIDNEYLRLRLLSSKCTTVPELISVVSTMKTKEAKSREQSEPAPKRPKLRFNRDDKLTCFKCGKIGHIQSNCANEKVMEPKSLFTRIESKQDTSSTERKPKCGYCDKLGHTESTCFRRMNDEAKTVNMARLQNDVATPMKVVINGRTIIALFDSGADRSLVRKTLSLSLPGKRDDHILMLKGIGGSVPIVSCQRVLLTCEINSIFVEIYLHVVEDHEISCELIIGSDLLKIPGLAVNVSAGGATLTRTSFVMVANSTEEYLQEIDTDLTNDTNIVQLKELLKKHREVFTIGVPKTKVTTGCLEIQLKDPSKVVSRRPYRMAPVEREKTKTIIGELIANGIVRESTSNFASPVILVKKKNGDDRMCIDYRELNNNTVPIKFPLPIISDQIDKLSDAEYFISLDMAQGFHQIPIHEESIHKTAFITPDGLFEYVMMPFGLMNAPAIYQRSITAALRPLLDKVLIYIDDILIKCKTFEEGLTILDEVLCALHKAGFAINAKKCSFFKKSIEYLGNVISEGTVRPSPRKVEALEKSPIPCTVKQVRQFCGLASYFRRFIPSFSERMIPLYQLTKKDARFHWTPECENARLDIIRRLTSSPVLSIFQEGLPLQLHTDASSSGLGAILLQMKGDRQHVIAYMSMRTTEPESHYHSYELETLAIIRAVKHFRQYLYGRNFTIVTDCNAIKASMHKHELLPRIHRWWAYLQHFDFTIEYRQGTRMKHADFFSRNPIACINLANTTNTWLKIEQRRDADLASIIRKLEQGIISSEYKIKDSVLLKRHLDNVPGGNSWKKVVPKSYQWSIINAYHTALKHFGWEKTLSKIQEEYWFPEISTTVRRFVDNCVICKTSKGTSGAKQIRMHPIEKNPIPFHTIHIDITGSLTVRQGKHEYVVVIIDAYTKFSLLTYATDKTSKSLLVALKNTVSLFGAPKQIISDQDTAFKADFEEYCKQHAIYQHFIAPGASRGNGQVERMMAVVKNGLTIIRNYELNDWKQALDALQLAMNCTKNKTTNVSPLKALTGRQNAVPAELIALVDEAEGVLNRDELNKYIQKKIIDRGITDKQRFDKRKAQVHRFQKGEIVLFKVNPRVQIGLDLKYPDAYEIWKVLPNDRYLIKKMLGRGRPKKAAHDQLRLAPKPGLQVTADDRVTKESVSANDQVTNPMVLADDHTDVVEHVEHDLLQDGRVGAAASV